MFTLTDEVDGEIHLPVKVWLPNDSTFEMGDAFEQTMHIAHLPFAFHHIAILPDCLTEDTEILTENGFKLITELTKGEKIAEECPWSYKDIDTVMSNQQDLVTIARKLKGVCTIKG